MRISIFIVATLAMIGAASAQTHAFGPAVGVTLPAISAPDQNGTARTLASLAGERGTVLLLTRAADWCPFCQQHMIDLEAARAQIEQRGYRVVTISTDTPEELARFGQRRSIGYTMLSDEQAAVVRQLNLLDPTQPPNSRHNGLPVPTILILSPQGEVRARLGDASYRVRPSTAALIEALDSLR